MKSIIFIRKEEMYKLINANHIFRTIHEGPTALLLKRKAGFCPVVVTLEDGIVIAESQYFRYHYPYPEVGQR